MTVFLMRVTGHDGCQDEKIRFSFNLFDLNKDGSISRDELRTLVTGVVQDNDMGLSLSAEVFCADSQMVNSIPINLPLCVILQEINDMCEATFKVSTVITSRLRFHAFAHLAFGLVHVSNHCRKRILTVTGRFSLRSTGRWCWLGRGRCLFHGR